MMARSARRKPPNPVTIALNVFFEDIRNSTLLPVVFLTPIVLIAGAYLYWLPVWITVVVMTIMYSVRRVGEAKVHLYKAFERDMVDDEIHEEGERVAWLNMAMRKYWISCVTNLLEPKIKEVTTLMEENKPGFLYSLRVGEWKLGNRPPRVDCIRAYSDMADSEFQCDVDIHFVPDFFLTLVVEMVKGLKTSIVVADIKLLAQLRIHARFDTLFPDRSIVSLSLSDDPTIDFAVKTLGADVCSVPGLNEWLERTIHEQLKPRLLWPQHIAIRLGGGAIESPHQANDPISKLAVVFASERQAPNGYLLLERTAGGSIPADLNYKAEGKSMYLCYKRLDDEVEEEKPITSVCIIFPNRGEEPPPGFLVLEKTASGEDSNLNAGTKGEECFLCFSYTVGDEPITGLLVANMEEDLNVPPDSTKIELSPSGHDANLNAARSKLAQGLTKITIVDAQKLKAADVGGTSDPFCRLWVGDSSNTKPTNDAKKTRVIDKELNPVWNESFVFHTRQSEALHIAVYDKDVVGKDDFLGRVCIMLSSLVHQVEVDQWLTLQHTSTGRLHVKITALDWGLPLETPPQALDVVEEGASKGKSLFRSKAKAVVGLKMMQNASKSSDDASAPAPAASFSSPKSSSSVNVKGSHEEKKPVAGGKSSTRGEKAEKASPSKRATKEDDENDNDDDWRLMSGFLWKLPTRTVIVSRGFQRRWFVLNKDQLLYHKTRNGKPAGGISLHKAEVKVDAEGHLIIATPIKTLHTKPDETATPQELEAWRSALEHNIKLAANTSRFKYQEHHVDIPDDDE